MRLNENEAKAIVKPLLLTLSYLHQKGVYHGNFKSDNIMFADRDRSQLKLTDFAIPTLMQSQYDRLSNVRFMAPEVVNSEYQLSPFLDVWSVGCVLFEMLTGCWPFVGSVEQIKRQIMKGDILFPDYLSEDVKELFRLILRRDPEERLSVKQILVQKWLDEEEIRSSKLSIKEIEKDSQIVFRTNHKKKLDAMHKELKERRTRRTATTQLAHSNTFINTLRKNEAVQQNEEKFSNATVRKSPFQRRKTRMLSNVEEHINMPNFMKPTGTDKEEKQRIKKLGTLKMGKLNFDALTTPKMKKDSHPGQKKAIQSSKTLTFNFKP